MGRQQRLWAGSKGRCVGIGCSHTLRGLRARFDGWLVGIRVALGTILMRMIGAVALLVWTAGTTADAAAVRFDAEAVRLNNRGVAQMGQQFTDRAADSFAAAMKKDPKLAQA